MNAITALEIFGNPKDLFFGIKEDPESKKWYLSIMRGPGHRYKMLLTGEAMPDRETALNLVRDILAAVRKFGHENFPHLDGREDFLTEKQKDTILLSLEQKSECTTYI